MSASNLIDKDFQRIKLDMIRALGGSYERNRLCLEDYEFAVVEGAQWKGSSSSARDENGVSYEEQFRNKPRPEINKIFSSINRLIGQKQRLEMNAVIISNSDEATDEDAQLLQSRWRNDFQSSLGSDAVDNSDKEAYFGGFGAYKLVSKYEDEENPDQEKQYLCVEPIYSAPSSVVFGPSLRRDKSDCKQSWHIIRTNREAVKEEFGVDVASINGQIDWFDWDTDSTKDIYLAHYYEVVQKTEIINDFGGYKVISVGRQHRDESGFKITSDDLKALKDSNEYTTVRKKVRRVEYSLLAGDQYLIKKQRMPFKRQPIVPQYGYYSVINGIEYYCGEVRKRRDPQMFLNTYYSSLLEIMAAPQVEKPEYTPEQISRHASSRARADINNDAFIMSDPHKNEDGSIAALGPIGTQSPPQIGTGLAAAGQQLHSTLLDMSGTGQSTVPSNASADAIQQVNERQDDSFQPLIQGSMSSIKAACEAWIDAAQVIYFSNPRKLRVVDESGRHSQAETMQYGMADGNYGPFINSARGRYTVQVKTGETYQGKKDAELETTLKMLNFADSSTPQGQLLLNQAIISTTGQGGERSRKVANYQIIDNMMAMGLDPEPKTEEEKEYVAQKMQQMQQALNQPQQPDPVTMSAMAQLEAAKAETMKASADMAAQQNRAKEIDIQAGKIMADTEAKNDKLRSDMLVNVDKSQQNQQKINNDARNNATKNAIEVAKLERQANQDMNQNIRDNMRLMAGG